MSGKRGRHPKKSGGRATPKGTQPSGHVSAQVRAIFANASEVVREDPADAESFASSFQQVFREDGSPPRSLASTEEVLREALRVGGLVGLFVAKSIRVFGPREAHARADLVYEKLAAKTSSPRWLAELGNVTVGEVAVLRDQYGDGFGVYLEYEDSTSGTRSVGVYIDANMGGIVKDVIDGPPLAMVRELAAAEPQIEVVAIDPAEARARVEAAFALLDEDYDLDLSDDVDDLRALAEQRFSLLPSGGSVPDETIELADDEREELIDAFVSSAHFFGLPDEAREIVETICEFADDGDGNPLRWSPVVVEIFLTGWLPNEVIAEAAFFVSVPVVLRSWIRFAGEQRGLDASLVEETVRSIDQWLDEYDELVRLPAAQGAAELIVQAMATGGVDLDDADAVQSFIDDYYADLDDVDVDLDRAEEGLLERWGAFEVELVEMMKSSLAPLRGIEPPHTLLASSAATVRAGLRSATSPIIEAGALSDFAADDIDGLDDLELVSSVAAAWFEPMLEWDEYPQIGLTVDDLAQASVLEHTDLLRVIIALAREGPGADASPVALARLLDATPEDREVTREAFGYFVTVWQAMGVVDSASRLTALGQWLLPRAFAARWGGDFDE
ncbi:MAG TPA: hypothetical protein VM282_11470 [Acidimicrobiales bacterium]|nr:hypothetical protein [Acidimicrobiales bacterium]